MRRVVLLVFTALLLTIAGSACAKSPAPAEGGVIGKNRAAVESNEVQFTPPAAGSLLAALATSKGTIMVVLYPEYAGRAVDNFQRLAEGGSYNNTLFHRVVKDFVIQGGDPTGTGEGGQSIWKTTFPLEVNDTLRHYSGAFCMAKGEDGGNGSQFYIVATPQGGFSEEQAATWQQQGMRPEAAETYRMAGGAPYLDNTDTVLGQVMAGMEIVDEIAAAQTDDHERPKAKIQLLSVTFSRYTPPAVPSEASPPLGSASLPEVTVPPESAPPNTGIPSDTGG